MLTKVHYHADLAEKFPLEEKFESDFEVSSIFTRNIVLEVHEWEIVVKKSGHVYNEQFRFGN